MEKQDTTVSRFLPRPAHLHYMLGRQAGRIWRQASDFLFPPGCPGCGRMLMQHDALCQTCWQDITFIERPYCDVLGLPFSHDLGTGFLSAEAIADPPVFDRLRSVCAFNGTARNLVHALKYRDRTELAPMMAGWMARAGGEVLAQADVIVPVPLHRFRLLQRKFNQASELARAISVRSETPFDGMMVRRKRATKQQIGLGKQAREDNMRGAFEMTERGRSAVLARRIVLVDDVYTTGATVAAVTKVLKKAGAADVTVLTFARAMPDII